MANSITLAKEYLPILDEVFASESLTADLTVNPMRVRPTGRAGSFEIQKLTVVGAGDYSRATGHPAGDAGLTWEEHTYANDRGRRFTLDSQDAVEAEIDAMTIMSEFIRTKMTPEIDACRFARLAGTSSIDTTTGAALSDAAGVLAAWDVALLSMRRNHVKQTNLIAYLEAGIYSLLKNSTAATRFLAPGQAMNREFETIDNIKIVIVPKDEFVTGVTLDAGATPSAGGFTKTGGAKDINFMLVDKTAVWADVKHGKIRMFDPDTYQNADAWAVDYRVYHDAFVLENKVKGVYLHKSTS